MSRQHKFQKASCTYNMYIFSSSSTSIFQLVETQNPYQLYVKDKKKTQLRKKKKLWYKELDNEQKKMVLFLE
jgi:hypothetical protein